jgi:hypothetical protein
VRTFSAKKGCYQILANGDFATRFDLHQQNAKPIGRSECCDAGSAAPRISIEKTMVVIFWRAERNYREVVVGRKHMMETRNV